MNLTLNGFRRENDSFSDSLEIAIYGAVELELMTHLPEKLKRQNLRSHNSPKATIRQGSKHIANINDEAARFQFCL